MSDSGATRSKVTHSHVKTVRDMNALDTGGNSAYSFDMW